MELFSITWFPPLLAALVLIFAIREVFVYKGVVRIKYIATPLVTALIIGFAILSISVYGINKYRVLILTALILSLIADTLLMINEVNLLEYGILYFLSAHIVYIIAFMADYSFKAWNIIVAALLAVCIVLLFMKLRGKTSGLDIPVLIYSVVVSTMLFFAASTLGRELGIKSLFMCVGATFFFISDFLVAYFSFIKPNKHESVISWAFYAPGQLLIALSCFS
jgi:uncharacterized membrane protein YhhN